MQSGNNEEYIDLIFERIEDASILSNFYCGIPDMDDFIHEKLQGYLNRTECDAYVICCRFLCAMSFHSCRATYRIQRYP